MKWSQIKSSCFQELWTAKKQVRAVALIEPKFMYFSIAQSKGGIILAEAIICKDGVVKYNLSSSESKSVEEAKVKAEQLGDILIANNLHV